MNNPDQITNFYQPVIDSVELHKLTIENVTPLIEAVCANLARDNKGCYERGVKPVPVYGYVMAIFEEALIELYLHKNDYNQTRTSDELDMNRGTMRKKIAAFKAFYKESAND